MISKTYDWQIFIFPRNNVWLTRTLQSPTMNNWAALCSMIICPCSYVIFFFLIFQFGVGVQLLSKNSKYAFLSLVSGKVEPKGWNYLLTNVQSELLHPKQELPDRKRQPKQWHTSIHPWHYDSFREVSFLYTEQQWTAMEFGHALQHMQRTLIWMSKQRERGVRKIRMIFSIPPGILHL